MLLLTIIGDSSDMLASEPYLFHHDTARASASALQRAELLHSNMTGSASWLVLSTPALTALHISWPTANLDSIVSYFEGTLSGTKVSQASVNGTSTYYGKLFSSDTVELRWEQSSKATQGPTTVAEWEAYTAALHKKCIPSANSKNQGFDRLADQHIGGRNPGGESLDTYITAQKKAGLSYRVYVGPQGNPDFLYLYGPNGWGTQITGSCSSECGSNLVFYNECTQGTTGH